MTNNHIASEYKTRDLAESSALILKKQKLLRIDREGKTCWFVFENEKMCKEISRKFFFDTLLVNAREYYEAMNLLKNRIFAKE